MKNEIKRQAIHIMLGTLYAIMFLALEKTTAIIALILIFGIGSLIAFLHMKKMHVPILKTILESVEREHEKELPGKGALSFTLGIILTSLLFQNFNTLITVGAIMTLALGDGFSTITGIAFGKTKTGEGKTLEGTIGGIIAAAIGLSLITTPFNAVLTAGTAMLMEYVPVNDNYTMPLTAGIVLLLLI